MKIGILTFHMAFNYGAMLQSYALSKKLNDMGKTTEIIDYRLPFIDKYHHKTFPVELFKTNSFFMAFLKIMYRVFKGYYTNKKWNRFYSFMTKKLPLSKQVTKEQLKDLEYDAYICGSDQIWNGALTGTLQGTYFCDFEENGKKKIAYAASCGTNDINGEKETIKKLLEKFDSISVRERALCETLKLKYGIDAQTVVDPVFLLTEYDWVSSLVKKQKHGKYVLIYAFDETEDVYEIARKVAKERGAKIIAVAYRRKNIGDDILQITDAGPEEFLSLVYNADFVCTTSFHGTAFSIIFNKEFLCFPHPLYRERTDSVLDMFKLSERNVEKDFEFSNLKKIDYACVNSILQKKRTESIEFLENSLNK